MLWDVGCGLKRTSFFPLLLLLAVFAGMPVDVAAPAPQAPKTFKAKIDSQIVGSVRLADLYREPADLYRSPIDPLVWCFKLTPAFIYSQGRQVMRFTFGGVRQEMMTFDRELDEKSVQCSDDGSTMAVLSYDNADFLVRRYEKVGHYKTAFRTREPYRKLGQMLSADGTMMASPFPLTFSSGYDVLREMRVLDIQGESFSWRDNKVLYFDRATTSVRSYDTATNQTTPLKQLGGNVSGREYDVGEIAACGKTDFVSVFWSKPGGDEKDMGNDVVSLNGDLQIKPGPGAYSQISLSGRPGFGCILQRFWSTGESEYRRWQLLLEDGLMKYVPPRGISLTDDFQVSARDCLVLGRRYVYDKDGSMNQNEESVVAVRITRAGRCGN